MNPKLQTVQTALQKVESIAARRDELQAEQKTLQGKIQKLTARVADGDVKAVNDLAIASARSAYGVPNDLKSVQAEFDAAIVDLRATLPPLTLMVAKAYKEARDEMEAIASEFLKTHISRADNQHAIERMVREIVEISDSVQPLDHLNLRFSSSHINPGRLSADSAIARARDAIKSLASV